MLQVNFEPLCAILILSRNKSPQCKSFNPYKPCSHLHIICFLLFMLMSARKKKTNLYLNLFLNISFVLIYLFCYYHATVIENIVYTRLIMYLAFAIFSIEMYNYHFDQIFVIFLGWCVKLVDVSTHTEGLPALPEWLVGSQGEVVHFREKHSPSPDPLLITFIATIVSRVQLHTPHHHLSWSTINYAPQFNLKESAHPLQTILHHSG